MAEKREVTGSANRFCRIQDGEKCRECDVGVQTHVQLGFDHVVYGTCRILCAVCR